MKTRYGGLIAAALLAFCLAAFPAAGQKNEQAELALRAATKTETVDGDLKSAIEQYKKIIAQAGAGRATVATALLRMGQCYEKMGQAEARAAYERLVREFGDQAGIVAQARARLAALGGSGMGGGPATRRVLADASGLGDFLTADGKTIRGLDRETGDIVQFDVAGGLKSRIKNTASWSKTERTLEDQVFSRDGKQIAYNAEVLVDQKDWVFPLRIRNLDGSGLRTLINEKDYIKPLDWSPDAGSILALRDRNKTTELTAISTVDGSVRVLKGTLGWLSWGKACFSPDGRFVAFNLIREGNPPHGDVFLMTSDGRNEVVVAGHSAEDQLLGWTPDGKSLVFLSDRSGTWDIWAVAIIGGKPQGEPALLKKDFGNYAGDVLGFAPDGSLYYKSVTRLGGLFSGAVDLETGKFLSPPSPVATRYTRPPSQLTWSPDGRNLAYISFRGEPAPGNLLLTIRSAATGEERFLLPRLLGFNQISWAPDSRSIIAIGATLSGFGVFRIDAETSEVTKLADGGVAPRLCPDGKTLLFVKEGPGLAKRNLDTGEESGVVKIKGLNYDLSPDGREVVFQVDDAVKTVSLNGGEPREVFRGSAAWARWTKDGRTIIVRAGSAFWRVPAQGGTPFKLSLELQKMHSFALHPDNRRFALSLNGESKSELWVMENFLPPAKAVK
jgi:Tol biopolymer transport system component